MKIKRLAINQLRLRYHPTLTKITSCDHLTLSSPVEMQGLPLHTAQTLLDLYPVLACKVQDGDIDWQLSPNPALELFKQHPERHKLLISIHYYPELLIDGILEGVLLFAPALSYRGQSKLLSNLSYRVQQSKLLLKYPPSKKKLAQWANVKPSAIRHIKDIKDIKDING